MIETHCSTSRRLKTDQIEKFILKIKNKTSLLMVFSVNNYLEDIELIIPSIIHFNIEIKLLFIFVQPMRNSSSVWSKNK